MHTLLVALPYDTWQRAQVTTCPYPASLLSDHSIASCIAATATRDHQHAAPRLMNALPTRISWRQNNTDPRRRDAGALQLAALGLLRAIAQPREEAGLARHRVAGRLQRHSHAAVPEQRARGHLQAGAQRRILLRQPAQ